MGDSFPELKHARPSDPASGTGTRSNTGYILSRERLLGENMIVEGCVVYSGKVFPATAIRLAELPRCSGVMWH